MLNWSILARLMSLGSDLPGAVRNDNLTLKIAVTVLNSTRYQGLASFFDTKHAAHVKDVSGCTASSGANNTPVLNDDDAVAFTGLEMSTNCPSEPCNDIHKHRKSKSFQGEAFIAHPR
jgi:hypothetical protein